MTDVVTHVRLGPIAHGGHCVARLDGRVIFVRHGLPGELVDVALTDTSRARMWRGDAVVIHEASAHRVTPECRHARADGCGGCDFQHVSLDAQRRLKADVVTEQLRRLAGIEWPVTVEAVGGGGLGWRTRVQYRTDDDGALALRKNRSHDLVVLGEQGCPLAARQLVAMPWPPNASVRVAGQTTLVDGEVYDGERMLTETVSVGAPDGPVEVHFEVAADGFWQVHPQAASTLVGSVLDMLAPQPGERALDLYCGVGLFAAGLVAAGCEVAGMELSGAAVHSARRNVSRARFSAGAVEKNVARLGSCDVVVLDPPRKGAGRAVVDRLCELRPRAMAYVACDPAALARDLSRFAEHGYALQALRAFDLFPMTHHVECVAVVGRS